MTSASASELPTVVIALGANLGDRALTLRRAIDALGRVMRVVRVSSVYETEPVDAPAGSPNFLNMVVAGFTRLEPLALLDELQRIEASLGRRRGIRNAPRTIDLDLIAYSSRAMRTKRLTLPHPRYQEREFVMEPLRELELSAFRSRRPAPRDASPSASARLS
ncbi:MAG: 2-amino-4-hydroxy-6-hydroxymethyldihydropteridine diphosphokinase [Acidobacteria bacterium]|nr:2-amino-4-hydroxy-6-hydroxymethyldihydropteridine diphosphokinase [Acidobacteriota bacterium]